LDSGRDAGEYFVGDGADGIAQYSDWEVIAKDEGMVSRFAFYVGDIDHADVHADVAYVFGPLAVDEAVAVAVAQTAVESVGISDWYGCDARRTVEDGAAAVADGVACGHVADL